MTELPVAVDLRCLQGPRRDRGIGRYVRDLITSLARRGVQPSALLFDPNLSPPPAGLIPYDPSLWRPNTRGSLRSLANNGTAHYLLTSPFELGLGVRPSLTRDLSSFFQTHAIVYDFIPLLFPDRYLDTPLESKRYRSHLHSLRLIDSFFSISKCTAHDGIELGLLSPNNTSVIGGGPSLDLANLRLLGDTQHLFSQYFPNQIRPYFLCVGSDDWRKNLSGLLDAWSIAVRSSCKNFDLVIACHLNDQVHKSLLDQAKQLGIQQRVRLVGRVSDYQLMLLYSNAYSSIFPSHYEGLGLPVLESLLFGTPVAVSRGSALDEIEVNNALRFNSHDAENLANVLGHLVTDETVHDEAKTSALDILKNWNWDIAIDRLLEGILPTESVKTNVFPRDRIALVSPFVPAQSGIANYSTRFVSELKEHFSVVCFAEGPFDRSQLGDIDVVPITAFNRGFRKSEFDAVVVCLGNSPFHHGSYEILRHHGGVAWMHDVNMSGLHLSRAQHLAEGAASYTNAMLALSYPGSASRLVSEFSPVDTEKTSEYGLFMTRTVSVYASAIIVSSDTARRLLLNDLSGYPCPRIFVLPLAHDVPAPPNLERSRKLTTQTVVTVGFVHEMKMPRLLVEAIALIPVDRRPMLIFAGQDILRDSSAFWQLVADAGMESHVQVTGWLEDEELNSIVDSADLVVQLRMRSHGESSAAISSAISRGKPVLTNMPVYQDSPNDALILLDIAARREDLADAISNLLQDPGELERLSNAALVHATQWSFREAGLGLRDILQSLVEG